MTPTASTPPTLPTLAAPPTDCSDTGALVSYSQQVAEANTAIDANARSLGEETVYMYMSHFFDLPSICADNTAYYPDWITNSDRQVYDSYLATSNTSQLVTTIPQMIINADSIVSEPAAPISKFIAGRPGAVLADGLDGTNRVLAAQALTEEFQTVTTLLDADSTPEEIVTQMRSNLSSTWSDDDTKGAVIGTIAALMMPTIGGALFSLGTIVISFELTGVNSFMQTAAFNSMRASTSGRAGERLLRSYGL